MKLIVASLFLLITVPLFPQEYKKTITRDKTDIDIRTGAAQTDKYLSRLNGKTVAVVANQTSRVGKTHLIDTLLSLGININKVFAPEHGFRGMADAGEHVKNFKDKKTGLPIVSLYGGNKKPTANDLRNIDVVLFDIQDVGVRFYTYISTMHYVMEACAENNKDFIVLDRPNPNGFYVDGPVLETKYKSFVGMHPVPLVHGMTIAEYAKMINGEGWLKNGIKCKLNYILCEGYSHKDHYQLPVKPSPNLPDMAAVYLYPSVGLFEGTVISVGRGTDKPFKVIGHPELKNTKFNFTPVSVPGATNPPYKGEVCYGFDLSDFGDIYIKSYGEIYLYWLMSIYENFPEKEEFFNSNGFFNLLAGNSTLKQQIIEEKSESEITQSWQEGLVNFKKTRKKYLLYPDF